MLRVVEVACSVCQELDGLPHVKQQISVFLLDLYGIPLYEAVRMKSALSLLQCLTSPGFGKRFSHREVAQAMCSAAARQNLRVIQKLFEYDPLIMFSWSSLDFACRVQEDQPFDVAARNGHLEILKWLISTHPRACTDKAIETAAAEGNLHVVEFLFECKIYLNADRALEEAASRGHLPVVEFLVQKGRVRCATCLIEKAALSGHFDIVHWLGSCEGRLHWSEVQSICQTEVQSLPQSCTEWHGLSSEKSINASGHDEMKHSLVYNAGLIGFKWLTSRFPTMEYCDDYIRLASRAGDVELVMWLLGRSVDDGAQPIHRQALHAACSAGQIEVVRSLVDHGYLPSSLDDAVESCCLDLVRYLQHRIVERLDWTPNALHNAVIRASKHPMQFPHCVEMVKLLDPGGLACVSTDVVLESAKAGNLRMLDFFLGMVTELRIVVKALRSAIAHGHLSVVRFLYGRVKLLGEEKRDLVSDLMDSFHTAGWHGKFETIRFILSHEEPGENDFKNVILKVVEKKDLGMLKFLHYKQVKGFADYMMQMAASVGSLSVLRFLHEHRHEGCTKWTMDCAASGGFLHIIRYLHASRQEGCCTSQAMDQAASNGHLEVVRFLHYNRHEGCTVKAMDRASANGHLAVVQFLHEYRQEGCSESALVGAVQGGHLEVAQFLVSHREEASCRQALEKAHAFNQSDIERWFIENHERSSPEVAREAAQRELANQSDFGRRLLLKRFLELCLSNVRETSNQIA